MPSVTSTSNNLHTNKGQVCAFLVFLILITSNIVPGSSISTDSFEKHSGRGLLANNDTCSKPTASALQQIRQLTNIFENSQLLPAYNFAKNNSDGRGITFGCIGFTTGTGEGYYVINEYLKRLPSANRTKAPLAKFLPTLKKIAERKLKGDTPLPGFIKGVKAAAKLKAFKDAQNSIWRRRFLNPSIKLSCTAGITYPLTFGLVYDTCIMHGFADSNSNVFNISCSGIYDYTQRTIAAATFNSSDAYQTAWFETFLNRRTRILNDTQFWEGTGYRTDLYKWIFYSGNVLLNKTMDLRWSKCPGTATSGPCHSEFKSNHIVIGGLILGSFTIKP